MKEGSAICCENAGNNFHLVIESGVCEDFETRANGAALEVVCAVDQARDAGLDDSAGAHAAGLDRDIEGCARHAIVAEVTSCFTNHDDLSVGGRVTVANGAVAGAGENFTVMDDAGADGDFTDRCCGAGLLEGDLHERDFSVNEFHLA